DRPDEVAMNYEFLKTSAEDRVAWLEYRRPPLNAIDWKMLREIPVALDELLRDAGVRVIVIASALDKFFSTGADLRVLAAMKAGEVREWVEICHGLVRQIREASKPLLGAIHGTAVGGGLEIVLNCDVRFAAKDARLGQPEINIGSFPPWGPRSPCPDSSAVLVRCGFSTRETSSRPTKRSQWGSWTSSCLKRSSGRRSRRMPQPWPGNRRRRSPPSDAASRWVSTYPTTTPSPSSSRRRSTSREPPTSPKASAPSSRSGRRSGSSSSFGRAGCARLFEIHSQGREDSMAIYLKYGDIDGDVTEPAYRTYI